MLRLLLRRPASFHPCTRVQQFSQNSRGSSRHSHVNRQPVTEVGNFESTACRRMTKQYHGRPAGIVVCTVMQWRVPRKAGMLLLQGCVTRSRTTNGQVRSLLEEQLDGAISIFLCGKTERRGSRIRSGIHVGTRTDQEPNRFHRIGIGGIVQRSPSGRISTRIRVCSIREQQGNTSSFILKGRPVQGRISVSVERTSSPNRCSTHRRNIKLAGPCQGSLRNRLECGLFQNSTSGLQLCNGPLANLRHQRSKMVQQFQHVRSGRRLLDGLLRQKGQSGQRLGPVQTSG
mmetsp:Transcript_5826/g.11661  ORF Transcript_5826/g.11661 Transcript_5826/m.11661 type:complete len:287 (+) Transcript_5826:567-1427(+)